MLRGAETEQKSGFRRSKSDQRRVGALKGLANDVQATLGFSSKREEVCGNLELCRSFDKPPRGKVAAGCEVRRVEEEGDNSKGSSPGANAP